MSKVIGITGGIASGKSSLTTFLRQNGYQVVDADEVVHDLQAPGGRLYQVLLEHFGQDILLADGQLDRAKLGQKIFSDEEARAWSGKVQGQIIREELAHKKEILSKQEELFFMDIPLLFEAGYETWFDEVWLVYVEEKEQLKRLMTRNNLSQEEAKKRLDAQWKLVDKRVLADKILDNNGSLESMLHQAAMFLKEGERHSAG